ncbi:Rap/Ran GTPase-activating protein [Entamoeba marina]
MSNHDKDVKKATAKFFADNERFKERMKAFDILGQYVETDQLTKLLSTNRPLFVAFHHDLSKTIDDFNKAKRNFDIIPIQRILKIIQHGILLPPTPLTTSTTTRFLFDCLALTVVPEIRQLSFNILLDYFSITQNYTPTTLHLFLGSINLSTLVHHHPIRQISQPLNINNPHHSHPPPTLPTAPVYDPPTLNYILPTTTPKLSKNTMELLNIFFKRLSTAPLKPLLPLFHVFFQIAYPSFIRENPNFMEETPLIEEFQGFEESNDSLQLEILNFVVQLHDNAVVRIIKEVKCGDSLLIEIYRRSVISKTKTATMAIDWYFKQFLNKKGITQQLNTDKAIEIQTKIVMGIRSLLSKENANTYQIATTLNSSLLEIPANHLHQDVGKALVTSIKDAVVDHLTALSPDDFDSFYDSTQLLVQTLLYVWLTYRTYDEKEWGLLEVCLRSFFIIPGVLQAVIHVYSHIIAVMLERIYEVSNEFTITSNALYSPTYADTPPLDITNKNSPSVQYERVIPSLQMPQTCEFLSPFTDALTPSNLLYIHRLLLQFFTNHPISELPPTVFHSLHNVLTTTTHLLSTAHSLHHPSPLIPRPSLPHLFTDAFLSSLRNPDTTTTILSTRALFKLYTTSSSPTVFSLLHYLLKTLPQNAIYPILDVCDSIFDSLTSSSFTLIPSLLNRIQTLPPFPPIPHEVIPTNDFIPFDQRLLLPTHNTPLRIVCLLHAILSLDRYADAALMFDNEQLTFEKKDSVKSETVTIEPSQHPFQIYLQLAKCFRHVLSLFSSSYAHTSIMWGFALLIIKMSKWTQVHNEDISHEPNTLETAVSTKNIEALVDILIDDFKSNEYQVVKNCEFCIDFIGKHCKEIPNEVCDYIFVSLCKLFYLIQKPSSKGCIITSFSSFFMSDKYFAQRLSSETVTELFSILQISDTICDIHKNVNQNIVNINSKDTSEDIDNQRINDIFARKVFMKMVLHSPFSFQPITEKTSTKKQSVSFVYDEKIVNIQGNSIDDSMIITIRDLIGLYQFKIDEVHDMSDIGLNLIEEEKKLEKEPIEIVSARNRLSTHDIEKGVNGIDDLVISIEEENKELFQLNQNEFDTNELQKEIKDIENSFIPLRQYIHFSHEDNESLKQQPPLNNPISEDENVIKEDSSQVMGNILRLIMSLTNTSPTETIPIKFLQHTQQLDRLLNQLDRLHSTYTHKIGLLYAAPNQFTQEDILGNDHGSTLYNDFVLSLGQVINLKGFNNYCGGLDTIHGSCGDTAIYYCDAFVEIIFHDSVRLPTSETDKQQVNKKKHIGNDRVHIIFCESDSYNPNTIKSQFNNAHIVVTPINGLFKITVWYKAGGSWGPLQNHSFVNADDVGVLVRETAMYLDKAMLNRYITDEYSNQYIARDKLIKQIARTAEPMNLDLIKLTNKINKLLNSKATSSESTEMSSKPSSI